MDQTPMRQPGRPLFENEIPAGYGPPPPAAAGGQPAYAAPQSARRPRRRRGGLQLPLIAISVALLLMVGLVFFAFWGLRGSISSLVTPVVYNNTPPANSFSVIQVVGTIQNASGNALGMGEPSYQHAATLNHIKQLAGNKDNTGILLYMNTPGGGVYESDEVYLALMDYKEQTGRPVWAFMADTCASGGYYICAAADTIVANRSTTTGSIGVYIQMTDTSGLYEKLGVETVLIRSGENKGVGVEGVPITEEQRSVYQGVVDEYYERFVQIVADGRGMSYSQAQALSDGRVYTASQALEAGLIDEVGNWDGILKAFEEETGATVFYPNFTRRTTIGQLLGNLQDALPKSEAEVLLDYAQSVQNGVPMALYRPG